MNQYNTSKYTEAVCGVCQRVAPAIRKGEFLVLTRHHSVAVYGDECPPDILCYHFKCRGEEQIGASLENTT
ncbi:MAG: hypothetical protein AABY07_10260 [Nanoarchaeota archaeon]